MVTLDDRGSALAALDDVGINRSLHQEIHGADRLCLAFEYFDKFFADDLALLFGIAHAFKFIQKTFARVRFNQIHSKSVAENGNDLVRLPLAQKTVVDEHAHEPIAHRFVHERCRDCAVHAAAHGA